MAVKKIIKKTETPALNIVYNDDAMVYTADDGTEITLPYVDKVVPMGFIRKNRKVGQEELGWMMLEKFVDVEELDKFDELPMPEAIALMKTWADGREASVGES
ncbi:hypothetical protein [Corynebacterium pygosceleis]|uniref:hypothetical protein n=1 Tax=Corynebacterium pygosceleis TaxID=2800406 RepID=UPI0020036B67|nr:hypothetical protein [Corynebacterium pygosceleis]MCK7676360.1 hypothetical protein [Corynebacterium pygosceleis]